MKNPIQSMAKVAVMLFIATISVTSCKKKTDTPAPVENEDITEVQVTLAPTNNNGNTVTYRAFFSKGYSQAATAPAVYTITSPKTTLTPGINYSGKVKFLNGTEDITGEITDPAPADAAEEGANNHQVYYSLNSAFEFLSYEDRDSNNKPIGVQFSMRTLTPTTTGNLKLQLIHKGNKTANSTTTPHIYNAATIGGSTDVDVTFSNVVVQ